MLKVRLYLSSWQCSVLCALNLMFIFLSCQPLIESKLPPTDVTARHAQSYWSEQCFWCKGWRICTSWRSGIHSSDKVSYMNILISNFIVTTSQCLDELVAISFLQSIHNVFSISDCKTVNILFTGKCWFSRYQVLHITVINL